MRDASAPHWQRWRVTLASPAPLAKLDRAARFRVPVAATVTVPATTPSTDDLRHELPGPDGIRHDLVARVRREIAAGTYDTEEKWLAAEEALLRRIEERL